MFSQLLKLIPWIEFEKLVKDTGAERASRAVLYHAHEGLALA